MSRRTPPDHRDPNANAGLRARLERRRIGTIDLGEGQRQLKLREEVDRLKALSLADLRTEAEEMGIEVAAGSHAARDAEGLRRVILERRLGEALGG